MKLTTSLAIVGLFAFSGVSFAAATTADPAPAAAKPTVTAPAPAATTDTMTLAKKCSMDADTKGLHGKARKKFRHDCKHPSGKM